MIFTLSLANSNCFTTTISANRSTRVTELNNVRPARTIAPRSHSAGPSGDGNPRGSVAKISHSLSIDDPAINDRIELN